MLNRIRQTIVTVSFAILTLLVISIPASAQRNHTLTVENNSGFDIYELHMSSVYDPSWERDLLGLRILYAGNSFTVTGIQPGVYDLKVVDEDRDECDITGVSIYQDMTWNLTPLQLVGCEFQ